MLLHLRTSKVQDYLNEQLAHIKNDITINKEQLTAIQLDSTKPKLLQKQTTLEKELKNAKLSIQHLTKDKKELAANTERSLTAIKDKQFQLSRKVELETKLNQMEEMFYDPTIFWYNTLNYRASKLSTNDQVVPVTVKIPEFSKNKQKWSSATFFLISKSSRSQKSRHTSNFHNKMIFQTNPIEVKISTTESDDNQILVLVVMPGQA